MFAEITVAQYFSTNKVGIKTKAKAENKLNCCFCSKNTIASVISDFLLIYYWNNPDETYTCTWTSCKKYIYFKFMWNYDRCIWLNLFYLFCKVVKNFLLHRCLNRAFKQWSGMQWRKKEEESSPLLYCTGMCSVGSLCSLRTPMSRGLPLLPRQEWTRWSGRVGFSNNRKGSLG